MKRTQIRTVEGLLHAYHDTERTVIGETSGNIAADIRQLDTDMRVIARNLSAGWGGCDCEGTYYGWFDGSDET